MQRVKTKGAAQRSHIRKEWARQIFLWLAMLILARAVVSGGVIKGTVYDEETGVPVPFATVRVEGTGRSMLANENGQYRLYVPEGRYQLKLANWRTTTKGSTSVPLTRLLSPTYIFAHPLLNFRG